MPELIDIPWFDAHTASAQTRETVRQIALWQKKALADNDMPIDLRRLELELDGDRIVLEASSAVNALEVYQEIFRDEDHFRVPGFSPAGASCVIDLGANCGFYSLLVKRLSPACKIIALEPNPYLFPLLRENLSRYPDITLLPAAIGLTDQKDSFELVRQIPSIGGMTLRQVPRKWLTEDMIVTCEVEYISLQSLFTRFGVEECDLLKIDIEGLEGELLAAAPDTILQRCKRIVLERHTPQIRLQVMERLCDCGFDLAADSDPECRRHYGNLYFSRKGL